LHIAKTPVDLLANAFDKVMEQCANSPFSNEDPLSFFKEDMDIVIMLERARAKRLAVESLGELPLVAADSPRGRRKRSRTPPPAAAGREELEAGEAKKQKNHHTTPPPTGKQAQRGGRLRRNICYLFYRSGSCRFADSGAGCRFKHTQDDDEALLRE
jgi:hypothetical protein